MAKNLKTLRNINIESRRRLILERAAAIIEREGMDALSMRKLARAAGLSVTTLYNLFGSRAGIVRALVHDMTDRVDRVLDVQAPLDDPIERCRAIITVSIAYIVEHESMFRPMFLALYHGSVELDADRLGIPERAAGMQRRAIEAAIQQGLLRNVLAADVLSSQIYHGYEMASLLWAQEFIDAREFEVRALYGLYTALLAAAGESVRAQFEAEAKALEPVLRAGPRIAGRESETA